jgi:hypothetical protein
MQASRHALDDAAISVKGQIDAPNFDNREGGVENDLAYREPWVPTADGHFSQAVADKRRALPAFIAGLPHTGKRAFLIYPVADIVELQDRCHPRTATSSSFWHRE